MTSLSAKRKKHLRKTSGQAVVEFALTLLLVLTLIFGIIEIGKLFMNAEALADAARAGARYAVTHGAARSCDGTCDADGPSGPSADPGNVVAVVQDVLSAAGLPAASGNSCPATRGVLAISVDYLDSDNATGKRVQVTACYGYVPMMSFLPFLSPLNLSSTTQGTITY